MQRLPTHLQITLACVGVMCCVTPCFADLSDGLVAEYLFEGNANDTSGNAFHATAAGPTLTTGRNGDPNSAYLFDDFLEVIQIPDAVLNARTDFSFCVSLNFTITPPRQHSRNPLRRQRQLHQRDPPRPIRRLAR